jgi:hypothetical protein
MTSRTYTAIALMLFLIILSSTYNTAFPLFLRFLHCVRRTLNARRPVHGVAVVEIVK